MLDRKPLPPWHKLGEGLYNHVYVSTQPETLVVDDKPQMVFWARKIPKYPEAEPVSAPVRAVATWNVINPGLPAHICDAVAWEAPFIAGTRPSDEEMATTLVRIYSRTRYIILDGYVPDNFVKKPDGEVVCVDVDLAYRRDEKASRMHFNQYVMQGIHFTSGYWDLLVTMSEMGLPKTANILKTLIMLDVSFAPDKIPATLTYAMALDISVQWENVHHAHPCLRVKWPVSDSKEEKTSAAIALPTVTQTTRDLFLKLHQQEMGGLACFFHHFTKVKLTQALTEIVEHAQTDKRLGFFNVRSANVLQAMGWFDEDNAVVKGSGLEKGLTG